MIFGLAGAFAVDLLFNFPIGSANPYGMTMSYINRRASAEIILHKYAILIIVSVGVVLMFTAVCLALRLKPRYLSLEPANWVQESLWICFILVIVVGFVLFDWYMFERPDADLTILWITRVST